VDDQRSQCGKMIIDSEEHRMATVVNIDDIRLELAVLSSRVAALERERRQNGRAESTAPFDLASVMPEVRRIAQELFPGPYEFVDKFDPEYPDDRYVLVRVEATGDIKEIADREEVWDKRIRQMWPDLWDTLRLFVVPR
jgi:hypothetical protein